MVSPPLILASPRLTYTVVVHGDRKVETGDLTSRTLWDLGVREIPDTSKSSDL